MKCKRSVEVAHKERSGKFLVGDIEDALCSSALRRLRGKVNLILTSPPFPLNHKKSYGNLDGEKYLAWLERLAPQFADLLAPNGSIVLEMGNSWERGRPVQSLLHLKALIAFVESKSADLRLCQQFACYNPSRLPSPAQWVTVNRTRTTDSFTHIWWMARTDTPKADNRRVLRPYSVDMLRLIRSGKYNGGKRPSQHNINSRSFTKNNGGSIAHNFFEMSKLDTNRNVRLPNVFSFANNASNDSYSKICRERKLTPHPARMPAGLAAFFIQFLTEPGDLVLDPFAGSNTTGAVAASLDRHWLSIDAQAKYVEHSEIRFVKLKEPASKLGRRTKGKLGVRDEHRRATHVR